MDVHVFHVINRAARRACLFEHERDYRMFLKALGEAQDRVPLRLLAFCVMPNHFHLVLWPRNAEQLSSFMHWLTATHSKRWHAQHASTGTGSLYQGRFKAFPVQTNRYFLNVCRYVERNPVRARLVSRAEAWPWSSIGDDGKIGNIIHLHAWPIPKPSDWCDVVNSEEPSAELAILRESIRISAPYGEPAWCDGLDLGCDTRGLPHAH